MAKADLPAADVLRQLLRYEPETGKLFYRERGPEWFKGGYRSAEGEASLWNAKYAGREACATLVPLGYKRGPILGTKFMAHVVIWTMVHGEPPENEIDHINGDRADNRLANLRAVTPSGNARNRRRRKDNASGVTGVSRAGNLWQVNIAGEAGEWLYLGRFRSFDEAVAVRKAAEAKNGFHPNHGR